MSVFNNVINAIDNKVIFRLEQIIEIYATKENDKKCWAAQNFLVNIKSKLKYLCLLTPKDNKRVHFRKKKIKSQQVYWCHHQCPCAPRSSDLGDKE